MAASAHHGRKGSRQRHLIAENQYELYASESHHGLTIDRSASPQVRADVTTHAKKLAPSPIELPDLQSRLVTPTPPIKNIVYGRFGFRDEL